MVVKEDGHPGGQVVIVTGGFGGIGQGIVERLRANGHVAIAFGLREEASTSETANTRQLENGADSIEGNVLDESDVRSATDQTLERHGRIDAVVNNAAVYNTGRVGDTTLHDWRHTLDVNLTGAFNMASAALPSMLANRSGTILNICSRAAWGQPNLAAYGASKGGLLSLTYSLALDYKRDGIRANAIVPTVVRSRLTDEVLGRMGERAKSAAGRIVEPHDVGNLVNFLISEEGATISGAVININSIAGQGGIEL